MDQKTDENGFIWLNSQDDHSLEIDGVSIRFQHYTTGKKGAIVGGEKLPVPHFVCSATPTRDPESQMNMIYEVLKHFNQDCKLAPVAYYYVSYQCEPEHDTVPARITLRRKDIFPTKLVE